MTRASKILHAVRINAAYELLAQGTPPATAPQELARSFGLSKRQAYRYLEQARSLSSPLEVPDQPVTLTVRVSERLVHAVRERSRRRGTTLSHFVTRALEAWLAQDHGRTKRR